jgi:DNA-binding NarL/FixJ family response regulator
MKIKVGIVDDKLINRQTVKEKLLGFKEINVTIEAKNGNDFLEKLQNETTLPDVVMMDLEMPEMDGIETIRLANANYPNIKFIVLTVFEDNDKIFEAIKAGAHGYLLKEDGAMDIVDAIVQVHEHSSIPMSPAIARKAMNMLTQLLNPKDEKLTNPKDEIALISNREMDVLKELISGKNYKFIGEKLYISSKTVRKHVANIYEKLHINSRAQLINIAHKKKWI